MKVKVISTFKDKNDLKIYKVGEILEVTEERYEELKGFVEKAEKKQKK